MSGSSRGLTGHLSSECVTRGELTALEAAALGGSCRSRLGGAAPQRWPLQALLPALWWRQSPRSSNSSCC